MLRFSTRTESKFTSQLGRSLIFSQMFYEHIHDYLRKGFHSLLTMKSTPSNYLSFTHKNCLLIAPSKKRRPVFAQTFEIKSSPPSRIGGIGTSAKFMGRCVVTSPKSFALFRLHQPCFELSVEAAVGWLWHPHPHSSVLLMSFTLHCHDSTNTRRSVEPCRHKNSGNHIDPLARAA